MSLPTRLSRLPLAPLPEGADTEITSVLNALDPDGTIPASRALSPRLRAVMQERVEDLNAYLRGSQEDEIRGDLLKMFLVLIPRKTGDEMDGELLVRAYCGILADVPPFAVKKAIGDFIRGKVGDGRFAPTAPELRREALRHVEPFAVERARIVKAMNASPRESGNMEERNRALVHVEETLRQLRARGQVTERDYGRLPTRAEAERQLADLEINPRPAPSLSPLLREKLGVKSSESPTSGE